MYSVFTKDITVSLTIDRAYINTTATPLHLAFVNEHKEVVEVLLDGEDNTRYDSYTLSHVISTKEVTELILANIGSNQKITC